MYLGFLSNFPMFQEHGDNNTGTAQRTANILMEPANHNGFFGINLWGYSLLSLVPQAFGSKETIHASPTLNRGLKRRAQQPRNTDSQSEQNRLHFRPYVSKVPWHTGARGFLSQLFPRYGHYCGPNWSSGKDGGSLLWDRRPIDWLDFCCYCHDMGYDSHDQAELLKADLAFLECLERPNMSTKGDAHVAFIYKTMCTTVRTTIDRIRMAEQHELERLELEHA